MIQGLDSALCGSSSSVDLRVVVRMWLILCGARGLENAPCSLESLDMLATCGGLLAVLGHGDHPKRITFSNFQRLSKDAVENFGSF